MLRNKIVNLFHFFTTLKRLFLGWLIVFSTQAALPNIDFEQLSRQIQAGDLIFRQGTAFISQVVMSVDDGKYSHVGMVVGQAPNWQVIHATPAEREGRADSVVIDDLTFFIDTERASEFTVFRVKADTTQRAYALTKMLAQESQPFSMDIQRGTYCSYLVWQVWQDAGVDLDVTFYSISLPYLKGNYLLPNDLAKSSLLTLIYHM